MSRPLISAAIAAVTLCWSTPAPAGPIMLFGDAPEAHASAASYAPLLQVVLDNVTNGQVGILVVGADESSPAANFALALSASLPQPQPIAFINGETIGVLGFSNYGLILVPSDQGSVPGGISASENALFATRSADVGEFLDRGGGIFAFTQGQLPRAYGYLGGFAPQIVFVPGGECSGKELFDDVTPTALGGLFGLDASFDGCCWISVFTDYAKFFLPMAIATEPGCPEIDGQTAALVASITPPSVGFGRPQTFPSDGKALVHGNGDLNGDGTDDVAAVIPTPAGLGAGISGSVQVFLNQGNGGKGEWLGLKPMASNAVGPSPSDIAMALLDDDDDLDLVVTNKGDNTIAVLLGAGDGTFGPAAYFGTDSQPSSVVVLKVNNDDFNDLAISCEGDNSVIFLFGDGTGQFFPSSTGFLVPSGPEPTSLVADDLDNDKDLDLGGVNNPSAAGAGPVGGTVFVILSLGGGNYAAPVFYPIGVNPTSVANGDVNNDGAVDLIASAGGSASVYVLLNNGDGTFQDAEPLSVGEEPKSVEVQDLDNDGDKDIAIVANDLELGPSVQVVTNRFDGGFGVVGGAPIFDEPISFPLPQGPNFVVSADLNVDTYFDLVTVNEGADQGTLSVLLNEPVSVPLGICAADVDGDGSVNMFDVLLLLQFWGDCPPVEPCTGDVDGDGSVGMTDLLAQLGSFGQCPDARCLWDIDGNGVVGGEDVAAVIDHQGICEDPKNCPWDLDHDGVVDLVDVFLVVINLGPCPGV